MKISLLYFLCLTIGSTMAQQKKNFAYGDSLFNAKDWKGAIAVYEPLLKSAPANALEWNRLGFSYYSVGKLDQAKQAFQTSLDNSPSPGLDNLVYARMAKVCALQNEIAKAFDYLTTAVEKGYANVSDLESHDDYKSMRSDARFKTILTKANFNANPCLGIAQAREFDFWVGEWDAYVTGTNNLAGHSIIQVASGGCMILENWTSTGATFSGKSMNFVDPGTKKWKQVWVGSSGLNVSEFLNGEYRDGAMRFEFETLDAQGKNQWVHFYFYNEGPNQVRQFHETSPDGNAWTTTYDFTYKRKK